MKSRIEIKRMIAANPKKAIDYLISLAEKQNNNEITNLLILKLSELLGFSQLNLSGTIGHDEYSEGMNKVLLSIFKIVDEFPERYFKEVNEDWKDDTYGTEIDKIRIEISSLIRELVEINIQSVQSGNPSIMHLFASKQQVVVSQAVRLLKQTKIPLSAAEYLVIANSLRVSIQNEKAEEIFLLAIENIDEYTDSALDKILVIRSYADFLYQIGRSADGAEVYESAILFGSTDEDYLTNGFTYQMKFYNETDTQNYETAIEDYKKAKAFYQQVGNSMVRNYNLQGLETTWNNKKIPASYSRP